MVRSLAIAFCLCLVSKGPVAAAPTRSGKALLGRIDFSVTGPPAARQHFLRGMLALHSFWYEEAADNFRAATAVAPNFAMGYWGEALTHYHPVWSQEDVAASRAVMAKLPGTVRLNAREQAFIDAARILFGDGDRATRWRGYAAALGKVHERFPADDEAATLYAVALLGTALGERNLDGQNPPFSRFAEAGAIGLDVLARSPQHPGAAHYVIHAFDDPAHAILALPAARRYAQIAPEAYHARHMPSHIFVQMGMWPEAVASNEAAWAASEVWVRRKGLDASHHDFHSLSWLLSIRFELGQRKRAEEVLGKAREALTRSRDPGRLPLIYSQMAGEYLLQTEQWQRMDEWLAPLTTLANAKPAISDTVAPVAAPLNTCHPATQRAARTTLEAQALLAFLQGEAAAARRDPIAVANHIKALSRLEPRMDKEIADYWKVRGLELDARLSELRGKPDDAVAALRKAIAIDERTPPSGPATDATARERLGELLLRQGKPAAAASEFQQSLEIHPRRARALIGAARAATAVGGAGARDLWARLGSIWADADADTPGLEDAQRRGAPVAPPAR